MLAAHPLNMYGTTRSVTALPNPRRLLHPPRKGLQLLV